MEEQLITPYYVEDHDRLDELFRQFQTLKYTDFAKAKESFRQFKVGLERHILWEEGILFPEFEAKTGMQNVGPTEVMRMEHRQIKGLLQEMNAKVCAENPQTELEEASFLSILSLHNEKEEHILYPAIDDMLNSQERSGVFAEMDRLGATQGGCCGCGHHEQPTQ